MSDQKLAEIWETDQNHKPFKKSLTTNETKNTEIKISSDHIVNEII